MGGKKKKVTVGYKYFWDIHAGLGRGPVDELVAITADEKNILVTTPQQITANTSIYIDKPDLFGGTATSGEGGVQGWLDIMFGESDQQPGSRLKGLLTGLVPGFRGIMSTFFSGMVSAYSASPKPWSYRVRRIKKGWDNGVVWYPEKAVIMLKNTDATLTDDISGLAEENYRTIHAMNPAHILVQAATSKEWGRGLSLNDELDLDAYRVMADTLYEEQFGLCFRYNRQNSLDDFIQQILDHTGAVQYCDLSSGKLTARLIRNDYVPDELPLFTYDNGILSVQDDDSSASDNAPNEIVVTWHDPVSNTDSSVRAQNLGSIQSVGLISENRDYPAIPSWSLGARVAQRDLEAGSSGLNRFTLKMDRRASQLTPACVFRISLPDRNIENMVVRTGSLKEESDGSMTVTVVQDVFGMPATVYSGGQQQGQWTPPDTSLRPVTQQRLMEIPYAILAGQLSAGDLSVLSPQACYAGIMATAPGDTSINYTIQSRSGDGVYTAHGAGEWTPDGLLLEGVTRTDTRLRMSFNRMTLSNGDALLIDDEILRVDAVDMGTGILTAGRGCADTIPAAHDEGTLIWLIDGWLESDNIEYLPGEYVSVRLLTNTTGGSLAPELASEMTLAMQERQARPYPPGDVRVGGMSTTILPEDLFTLSWVHRDRLLQADNLVSHNEGSTGPEAGTQYRITLLQGDAVIRTVITEGTTWKWPDPDAVEGEKFNRLTLYSEREGLRSLQGYELQRL
ncbi:phage tail protein [Salmonella enterica]|nr:phage tail protein [Salmonella enterica]